MINFIKDNKYLLFLSFTFALFFLRFFNLTSMPIFADEAIYIRWSQVMKAEETLRFLPLSDGKAPLFMWVTIPFLKFISDPLVAGRTVSVICGLGSMIGVAVLSYVLFKSKKTAAFASFLYATSGFTFFFDRAALADSMLSMFGLWTFIFSYLAIKHDRLDCAMLAGFCLGGAWLSKSPALFFAILLPTLLVFTKQIKYLPKSFFYTFVTFLIGYGMYNILRLGPNFHMIASRNSDYVYPLTHVLTSPFDPFKTFFKQYFEWIFAMGPWTLYLLILFGLLSVFKKHKIVFLILGTWILFPVLVQSEFARVYTSRYVLFTIPFLIVTASSAFLSESGKVQKISLIVSVVGFLLSLNFIYNLIFNIQAARLPPGERSGYLEEWSAGQGIYEISKYIREEQYQNPDEKIVVGTEGYFGTLPDGLQAYLNDLRQITVIGIGLNISEIPPQLAASKKAGNKTFLVINNERFKGDADKLKLKLIESYPKAVRANGTSQSLLFFEVTDASSAQK